MYTLIITWTGDEYEYFTKTGLVCGVYEILTEEELTVDVKAALFDWLIGLTDEYYNEELGIYITMT